MTLGECKRKALELIFQYSSAGTVIPDSYNDQADYTGRIPGLVNAAQLEIAAIRPIGTLIAVSSLTRGPAPVAGNTVYLLPEDCFRIMDGGLARIGQGSVRREKDYRLLFPNRLLLLTSDVRDLYLEYFRYPEKLALTAPDSTELDNCREAQECVPYYVAAQLVLYDDPYRYSVLYNEYLRRLALLRCPERAEHGLVENVYV